MLDAGNVHPLGRNDGGHPQVQQDRADTDERKEYAVMEHDDEIEHHHHRLERQRREGLHQRRGNGSIGGLAVRDISRHTLIEKLHRKPQHFP